MIRTAISFIALFGTLLIGSKLLTESQAQHRHQPCCAGEQLADPCDSPGLESDEENRAADTTMQLIEEHRLTVVESPVDLVLLPAAVERTKAANVNSQLRLVAFTEEPGELPVELAQLAEEPSDRPIGSGVREGISNRRAAVRATLSDQGSLAPTGDEADAATQNEAETEAATDELTGEAQEEGVDADVQDGETEADEAEVTVELALSPEMLALRDRVRNVLAWHIERPESVEQRSPWGVMHALIAYGVDTEVTQGGRRVNAIGWMCFNGPCRGQQLLYSENGRLRTRQGPGVQGHEGQFLAMLAQSKVKRDFPIRIDGLEFTVQDLIEFEKRTCVRETELTFKLIALSHYLDTDEKWQSVSGEDWDIPKLIKEELAQPVIGAACGGTHRMMGFSYAVKKREKQKRPMTGQWLRAKKYVDAYHDYTFKLQNDNGSFSTNWFRERGEYGDINRYIETTGHTLEWLVYSLPDDQLQDPRTVKAVNFLARLMWDNREHEWEIGPKGHALHALAIYDERVFQGKPGQRRVQLAEHRRGAEAR